MATVYGTNATSLLVTNPAAVIPPSDGGGRVRLLYDKYTFTADLADGDIIKMGSKIPKGARVIDAMIKFADLGSGSSGTVDVGWAASDDGLEVADDNGFLDDADIDAAADTFKASDNLANAPGIGKKFLAACQPIITATGTTVTSTDIELFILYALD